MLLIGSLALLQRGVITRPPKDMDFIATWGEVDKFAREEQQRGQLKQFYPTDSGRKWIAVFRENTGRITGDVHLEFEIAWPGSTAEELYNLVRDKIEYSDNTTPRDQLERGFPLLHYHRASIDVLLALKKSHRFLRNSPHFLKTRSDYYAIAKRLRAGDTAVPEWLQPWYKRREAETYDYGHPSLAAGQTKNAFFSGDGVEYVFDHDSIHRAVAKHNYQPIYETIRKDGEAVAIDKAKWNALKPETQIRDVLEEAYVLALERSQIPFVLYPRSGVTKRAIAPYWSVKKALEKICTSITSGWFREFAYEHYDEVLAMYALDGTEWYVERFLQGIRDGLVTGHAGDLSF